MIKPTWREEIKLRKIGFQTIAGLDEAGRGAWAGPIVAAAVILPARVRLSGLRDSKKLSASQREQLYIKITKQAICWNAGIISQKIIDSQGINQANVQAMIRAVQGLELKPDFLLVDALEIRCNIPVKSIIRGDQKVYSIAAASIIAKVTRDRILIQKHKKYPNYGFQRHKGYGTRQHQLMLARYGVSDYHRRSFQPVKKLIA